MEILQTLKIGLSTVILTVGSLLGIGGGVANKAYVNDVQSEIYTQISGENQKTLGAVYQVGGKVYYLYGGGISSSDTTITLTSFTVPVSNYPLVMSDFGTIGYLTIEPGSPTRQEFVSFTGITQNADGSASLTGITRGLSPITPYTASSTLQKSHSGGSSVVISNPPQVYAEFANRYNDESITGTWTFSSTSQPKLDAYLAPSLDEEFATKKYVDDTAFSGAGVIDASDSTRGVVELATGIEIASSTSLGTSGVLVIPASLATSTYNADTAGLKVVVTGNDGKIDNDFLLLHDMTLTGTTTVENTPLVKLYQATTTAHNAIYTWTKPTGLKYVDVELWGGGASGSGGSIGHGGGGGAYSRTRILAADLGSTETVTVGKGGASVTNATGFAGGNSSFGSHITVYGGGIGATGSNNGGGGGGGIGGVGGDAGTSGGAGGGPVGGAGGNTSAGGDSVFGGGGGGDGEKGGDSVFGGGGGGSNARAGGSSFYGGGGGGGGNSSVVSGGTSVYGGNGGTGGDDSPLPTAGSVPGGGGGGSNSTSAPTGAGGAGRVKITEYYF